MRTNKKQNPKASLSYRLNKRKLLTSVIKQRKKNNFYKDCIDTD